MKRTASERDGGGRKETGLSAYVGSTISIITNDGRHILGTLKGFDQVQNLVIEGSRERVYSPDEGVETLELGLYLMRGDCIAVVGELDEEADAEIDLPSLKAHPIGGVLH